MMIILPMIIQIHVIFATWLPIDSEELDSNSLFDFEVVTVEDIEDIPVTVDNIEDILASELPERPFPTLEFYLLLLSFDLQDSVWIVLLSKYAWLFEESAFDDYINKFSV